LVNQGPGHVGDGRHVVAPPGELRVNAGVVLLAGKTVWFTPERIRGEVLTTMRYTNRRLPVPLPLPLPTYAYSLTHFIICNLLHVFGPPCRSGYL